MNRYTTIIAAVFLIATMVSGFFTGAVTRRFLNNPRAPDLGSGRTVAYHFEKAGQITVYLTQGEWSSIAPYWLIFYVSLGGFVAVIVASFAYEGWKGFMKEWRRPDE